MIHEPPVQVEQSAEAAVNRVTLGSYLRSMWTLFRTAFTDPNSTTVVDLTTGRAVEDSDHATSQPPEGTL